MIPNSIQNLSINDRLQLVEDIQGSIAADQTILQMTKEQRIELDQRLDAYMSDGYKGREAGEAMADIRKRL